MTATPKEFNNFLEQEIEFCPGAPRMKPRKLSLEETEENEYFTLGEVIISDDSSQVGSSEMEFLSTPEDRCKVSLLSYLNIHNRRKRSL